MQPLAESLLTPNQVILLVAGASLIFAIRRWRQIVVQKHKGAQAGSPVSGGNPGGGVKSAPPLNVREVATELQALLADLEETSRRLTAQLDNRYTRMEQLLEEADARIRKLEALSATALTEPNLAPASAPAPRIVPAAVSEAERMLQRLRQERGAPAPTDDPAYQPIYSLADGGKSSREIAQELGRHPGEIELILALRQPQAVR
jgi:hypothetical protein